MQSDCINRRPFLQPGRARVPGALFAVTNGHQKLQAVESLPRGGPDLLRGAQHLDRVRAALQSEGSQCHGLAS